MSHAIRKPYGYELILSDREDIVARTSEMLGRAASLANSIRDRFPNKTLTTTEYGDHGGPVRARSLTLPWIVLPARPLTSMSQTKPAFTRRSATRMELVYRTDNMPPLDELVYRHLDQPLPKPDEVRLAHPHPVALAADAGLTNYTKYKYDSRSVSGQVLDLFAWSASEFGAQLPHRNLPNSRDNELYDFGVFKDYPDEAIVLQGYANDYHREKLDRFVSSLGDIALGVTNPDLNPR